MTLSFRKSLLFVLAALALGGGPLAARAGAEPLADDGGAEWRVEQPAPPPPPTGVQATGIPAGLGTIGDIEFSEPNRGALITSGNGGAIPPGVWLYNGAGWRELATVCGASDGRIAWAGKDEFWTISDGRAGQAENAKHEAAPLIDNSLCHFAVNPSTGDFEVVASYATLAFQSTSYPAMDAAACLSPEDCWFAGGELSAPQIGAFELHWNGHSLLREPYLQESHAVAGVGSFEGNLFESFLLAAGDRVLKQEALDPPLLRVSTNQTPTEAEPLAPFAPEYMHEVQNELYGPDESQDAIEALKLGADENALWAATAPGKETREKPKEAVVTVLRYSKFQKRLHGEEYREETNPRWTTVFKPAVVKKTIEHEEVEVEESPFPDRFVPTAIAAEPETNSAWIALDSYFDIEQPSPIGPALVARITANGKISDESYLSSKGGASHMVCPGLHDCWLVTSGGWLLHLATQAEREDVTVVSDPAFTNEYLLTYRPPDESVPQIVSVTLPEENSGSEEKPPPRPQLEKQTTANPFAMVTLPLLSNLHTRLVHRTTLELSFKLSVKAQVRLVAKRKRSVVASTAKRTLGAGSHTLTLHLDPRRWPTKLNFETHALAPLRMVSTRESGPGTETVATSLAFPNAHGALTAGLLH